MVSFFLGPRYRRRGTQQLTGCDGRKGVTAFWGWTWLRPPTTTIRADLNHLLVPPLDRLKVISKTFATACRVRFPLDRAWFATEVLSLSWDLISWTDSWSYQHLQSSLEFPLFFGVPSALYRVQKCRNFEYFENHRLIIKMALSENKKPHNPMVYQFIRGICSKHTIPRHTQTS